jgi:hypothetical protein
MQWSEYQTMAASFFSSLGMKTEIESRRVGARAEHVIDVYASGSYGGIPFNWVIECKAWKTNIPKEKVMALYSIVQDIGADRGFLLSEIGFQSGALLAARSSNITLTSIADLSSSTEKFSSDALVGMRAWEIQKAKGRLMELKRKSEVYEFNDERLFLSGELHVIQVLLEDALQGNYPICYPMKGLKFNGLEQVIEYADCVIKKANLWDLPNGG